MEEGLSIHNEDDVDWFRYTAPETGKFSAEIRFSHALGDLDLQLFDSSLTPLDTSDSQNDIERVETDVNANQVLFIKVFGFIGVSNPDYDLIVNGSEFPPDIFEGASGNDKMSKAASLGSASQVHTNLTIHNSGRDDWFKILAPQTGTIDIDILFSQMVNGVQHDLDLRVLDSSGTEVATSESSDDDEHVSIKGVLGQSYFIHVFGFEDATHPNYTLRVDSGNDPPVVSDISDRAINEDGSTGAIAFTVSDDVTPAGSLLITGASSDSSLIPTSNIVFGGSGTNRTVSVAPAANRSGSATITVTVNDGTAGITQENFVVTVTPVADTPNLTVSDANGIEDAPIPLNISASLKDTDGSETLSVLFSGVPVGAQLSAGTDNGGGNWTLTPSNLVGLTLLPAPNDSNSFTLTVRARATEVLNSATADNTQTLSVSVSSSNDPPTISAITNQTVDEDLPAGPIPFTVSDPETPANQLTVTATSNNQTLIPNANITLSGTGTVRTITVMPAANQSGGPVAITISASDGTVTTTRKFDVTIRPVNDPPSVTPIADRTIDEDTSTGPIPFTIDDVESGPGPLTVTATSSDQTRIPNSGIVLGGSGANRTITVTPATNQTGGPVTINVVVSDGTSSFTEPFTVTIRPTDDPPTISNIADRSVNEDTSTGAVAFTVGDAETAAGSLSVSATSSNQSLVPNANIVLGGSGADRTITVTPAENQHGGPVTITVVVSDGASSTMDTFALTVTPVNDAPIVTNPIGSVTTNEDGPNAVFNLSNVFSDVDIVTNGDRLTFLARFNSNPALVAATTSNGTLTLDFQANQTGTATIIVRATDNGMPARFAEDTISVTVTEGNDLPTITLINDLTTNEDTPTAAIPFTIGDNETPVGSLVVTASSSNQTLVPNANLVLGGSGASRNITITPAANQHGGPVTITLTVSDGTGSATETFLLSISSVNDLPTIANIADQTTDEDVATPPIPFVIGDVDTPLGSVMLSGSSSNPSLIPNANIVFGGSGTNRTVTLAPAANQNGSATITIAVDDGQGGMASDTLVFTVTPVNDSPVITSASTVAVPENTTSVITVTATDPEGDTVGFTIVGGADQTAFALNSTTGMLSFVSPKDFENPQDANRDNVYEVQVRASDGRGGTATQLVRAELTNVNETAPTVRIVDVSPDPRAAAVNQISFIFSEAVTGFDLADLTLTRSTNSTLNVPLGTATLTTTDNVTWRLGNVTPLTSASGIYELALTAAGSSIRNAGGAALAAGDTERWINGPGDADESRSFNQFDLIVVLQGGKYVTGQHATWREGDFNGDGLFNQGDIIVALQPNHYLAGPFAAVTADAATETAAKPINVAIVPELPEPTDDQGAVDVAIPVVASDPLDDIIEQRDLVAHPRPIDGLAVDAVLAKQELDVLADSFEL
jgi:hypothetical protein